jgi:hypothetical protein
VTSKAPAAEEKRSWGIRMRRRGPRGRRILGQGQASVITGAPVLVVAPRIEKKSRSYKSMAPPFETQLAMPVVVHESPGIIPRKGPWGFGSRPRPARWPRTSQASQASTGYCREDDQALRRSNKS